MVRYILENDEIGLGMCQTLLGYGGNGYRGIKSNEPDAFRVESTPDCTKGETD